MDSYLMLLQGYTVLVSITEPSTQQETEIVA